MYTVISKSGWEHDCWWIQRTYATKAEATSYADSVRQRVHATEDHYNVVIKYHRKSLAQLMDSSGDFVRFNDGTYAVWGVT